MATPEFPHFKDLDIEDRPLLDTFFKRFPPVISEFTFTNLFIWRHAYQVRATRFKDFLCLLSDQGEKSFFFPPIGEGDVMDCYRALGQYLEGRGNLPRFARVPEMQISQMNWGAEGFMTLFDRDQSDYVYLTEDLITLNGRRYHRKRNHIKQFKEKYPSQYIPITSEWIPECLKLQAQWCDLRGCDMIPGLRNESIAIREVLTHFSRLGIKGGAVLINGKVEAFTFGEPLNPETVVIHVEKANSAFDGLYPYMNQAFLEGEWSGFTLVNREQDLGEEGLRKAKESYFPHHMVEKYTITPKG